MKIHPEAKYVIPLENKKLGALNPFNFGEWNVDKNSLHNPRIIDYYLIHYIISGKGIYIVNGHTYQVCEGQAFLIKPYETVLYYTDDDNPWRYMWIGFDGSLADDFGKLDYVLQLDFEIFDEMFQAYDLKTTQEEYLSSCLLKLYCSIFDKNKTDNYIAKVKNYVKTNYANKISVSEISKLISLDRSYLSRIFKEQTSYTIQEYIIRTRMVKARHYIEKGYSVSETAQLVSYSDQFAFSTAFKKYYGISPSKVVTSGTHKYLI